MDRVASGREVFMSLNIALSSAVSSLLTIEQQMAVTSSNISNANTVGYTEK